MLIKVPSKDTETGHRRAKQAVLKLPATLRRSLTWDRGLELASHKNFTVATKVNVYFCDPQSPWQRGSNENTNGLLKTILSPKKTDLSVYSQAHLNKIALRLNQRPRDPWVFKRCADKLQASCCIDQLSRQGLQVNMTATGVFTEIETLRELEFQDALGEETLQFPEFGQLFDDGGLVLGFAKDSLQFPRKQSVECFPCCVFKGTLFHSFTAEFGLGSRWGPIPSQISWRKGRRFDLGCQ